MITFGFGISTAVLIWRGGHKTKRTKEVEERLRLALAMERRPNKIRVDSRDNVFEAPSVENITDEQNSREDEKKRTKLETVDEKAPNGASPEMEDIVASPVEVVIEEKMSIPADAARP